MIISWWHFSHFLQGGKKFAAQISLLLNWLINLTWWYNSFRFQNAIFFRQPFGFSFSNFHQNYKRMRKRLEHVCVREGKSLVLFDFNLFPYLYLLSEMDIKLAIISSSWERKGRKGKEPQTSICKSEMDLLVFFLSMSQYFGLKLVSQNLFSQKNTITW